MGAGMDGQGPDVSSPQVQYPLVDTQPQLCLKVSGPDHNLPRALPGLAEGSEEPDKGPTALGQGTHGQMFLLYGQTIVCLPTHLLGIWAVTTLFAYNE